MNEELVDFIAKAIGKHDWELSGHEEPFDVYEAFAEVAIHAYEKYYGKDE